MLIELSNFLKGSVRVRVTGAATERFLNLCAANNASFWNVYRTSPNTIEVSVSIPSFFIISRHASRSMCRLKVISKKGLPFAGRKIARRVFLWGGALLCAFLIWVLCGFVWTIEIIGCEQMTQYEVLSLLKEQGLHTGVSTRSLSSTEIKNNILTASNKIAWLAVNISGTHAVVENKERLQSADIIQDDTPCDVISDISGVVEALRVTVGRNIAQIGQTVQKGDRLASGTLASTQGDVWYVHAVAKADLRVWRTDKRIMQKNFDCLTETGNTKVNWALVLGNKRFDLNFIENEPFECYYKIVERNNITLKNDFRFPLTIIKETWVQCTVASVPVDQNEAERLLQQRMLSSFRSTFPDVRLDSSQFSVVDEGGILMGILKTEFVQTTGIAAPLMEETYDRTND